MRYCFRLIVRTVMKKYSLTTKQLIGLQKKREKKSQNPQCTLCLKGVLVVVFLIATASVGFVKEVIGILLTQKIATSW